jgi:phenylacetate-coenzyme A ligase PaaK-like adenylate-forming protein
MSFNRPHFEESVFLPSSSFPFNELCLNLFHHQYENNLVYREYADLLKIVPEHMNEFHQIPFLPIRFFKSREIKTGDWKEEIIFTSSGTTGDLTSRHFVKDLSLYEKSFLNGFRHFYGEPNEYVILALLPSYLERKGSSLIYMTEKIIGLSANEESGFFLDETDRLFELLKELEKKNKKTILLGVSFALLDFCEKYSLELKNTIVMETGGMKGRKKEITRDELHSVYKKSLGVENVHSEYGMTELLSQAYSKEDGKFHCPPWMKIIITNINDPKEILPFGKTGRVNIIDLANIDSCAFIATDDMGKINQNGSFEISGRIDQSDVRGCNLLV